MINCERCTDLILDYLYDLLDSADADAVRSHLEQCPECEQELQESQDQQRLLAKAARIYGRVPEFQLPERTTTTAITKEETLPTPTVEKETQAKPQKSSRWTWVWISVAAAVLIAMGTVFGFYQHAKNQKVQQLTSVKKWKQELKSVQRKVSALGKDFAQKIKEYEKARKELPEKIKQESVHIIAQGPASLNRELDNQIRVITFDLSGRKKKAKVTVKVKDPEKKQVLFTKAVPPNEAGEAVVSLPPGIAPQAGNKVQLGIQVDQSEVKEVTLPVRRPTYLTQVVLKKPVFRSGEQLDFRTLTLNRFSLKPPAEPIELAYSIVDKKGKVIAKKTNKTNKAGIGTGNFSLPNNIPDGIYNVQVQSGNKQKVKILPQEKQFLVRQDQAPQFTFNRDYYQPGELIRGNFRARRTSDGVVIPNQPLTMTWQFENVTNSEVESATRPTQLRADNFGNAVCEIQVPEKIPACKAKVEIQIHDGIKDEKIVKTVPVVPPSWQAEFYPEGGNFVAGVPNRIYCRISSPRINPARVQAQLLNKKGKLIQKVELLSPQSCKECQLFTGKFTLIPQKRNFYKLRVQVDQKDVLVKTLPFARGEGLATWAKNPVAPEGKQIDLKFYSPKEDQEILVLANCRGEVVDQQLAVINSQGTDVQLSPIKGTHGVVRITAYQPHSSMLVPLAERLVFREPKKRLDIIVKDMPGKERDEKIGQKLQLNICTTSEKGMPSWSWNLVSVVDELLLNETKMGGLVSPASFFFLGDTVQDPWDLEDANIVLSDNNGSKEDLDRFLAIAGWRTFSQAKTNAGTMMARTKKPEVKDLDSNLPGPAIFLRNNRDAIEPKFKRKLVEKTVQLHSQLAAVREKTRLQREKLAGQAEQTARKLDQARLAYRNLPEPKSYLRVAIGCSFVILVALSCVLIVLGFWRMMKGLPSTPVLGVAFGSLLGCGMLFLINGTLREAGDAPTALKSTTFQVYPLLAVPEMKFPSEDKSSLGKTDLRFDNTILAELPSPKTNSPGPTQGPGNLTVATKKSKGKLLRGYLYRGEENRRRQTVSRPQFTPKELAQQMATVSNFQNQLLQRKQILSNLGGAFPPGLDKMNEKEQGTVTALDYKRYYAAQVAGLLAVPKATLLWDPALELQNGQGKVSFQLPPLISNYRLIIHGHDTSGRLGFYEGRINALAN